MKFVAFAENRFQELTMASQTGPYDIVVDAQLKALNSLLNSYRQFLKWAMSPKLLYEYGLVCWGKSPEPEPVLFNKMKKEQLKTENEKLFNENLLKAEALEVSKVAKGTECESSIPSYLSNG